MNERIKQLAEQADLLIKKSNGDEFRYGNFDPRFQKFAELIIEECAQRAEAYAYMSANFSALAEELRRMTEDEESEEDSACPLCGFDGGTTCGLPNCQY